MRPTRRALAFALVLLSCGTPMEPGFDPGALWECTNVARSTIPPLIIGTVGQPVTGRVELPVSCKLGVTADVSVVDSAGDLIASEHVVEERFVESVTDPEHLAARITFTPQQPGSYFLVARFQPNVGLAQADALVAADHRADAPLLQASTTSPGLVGCKSFDRTEDGRLLCLAPRVALYSSAGVLQQELAAGGVGARFEHTVWVNDTAASMMRRCTEAGADASLTCEATAIEPLSDGWLLVPGTDDAIMFPSTGVQARHIARDAGTFVARDFDLNTDGYTLAGAARDGDNLWWSAPGRECKTKLGVDLTEPCFSANGNNRRPLGAGVASAWAFAGGTGRKLIELQTWAGITEFAVPEAVEFQEPTPMTFGSAPWFVLGGARYAVRADGNGLALDRLPEGGTVVSVTSTLITRRENGTLYFYRR